MRTEAIVPSEKLLQWINTHDCGVTPTAIRTPDEKIEIRVSCVNTETREESIERKIITTYGEARDALGY